ncbi:MAG: hypothetical protein M1828_005284 [Chrysothrix sp. TS-e1954]|nr:MAG: hypothetical protein M1828_005284 [Chrysothrix sp. TS-e1954]
MASLPQAKPADDPLKEIHKKLHADMRRRLNELVSIETMQLHNQTSALGQSTYAPISEVSQHPLLPVRQPETRLAPNRSAPTPSQIGHRASTSNDLGDADAATVASTALIPQTLTQRNLRIHWCVDDDSHDTEVVDMKVEENAQRDDKVIEFMTILYRKARGLRRWFSLTSCTGMRLVKFRRIQAQTKLVTRVGFGIPETNDERYEYLTFGMPAEHLILVLEAQLRHYLHRSCASHANFLTLALPKCNRELEAHVGTLGYGLEAERGWALWKFTVAFIAGQAGPVAFAIWWLHRHTGDIQNALTPEMTVLALLAIFIILPDVKVK